MTTSSTPAAGDSGALEPQGISKSARNRDNARKKQSGKKVDQKKESIFARIALFVRQVISELRKVVTPSRNELVTYTIVVLVFILIIMAYVGGLDYVFGKLVLWAFGG